MACDVSPVAMFFPDIVEICHRYLRWCCSSTIFKMNVWEISRLDLDVDPLASPWKCRNVSKWIWYMSSKWAVFEGDQGPYFHICSRLCQVEVKQPRNTNVNTFLSLQEIFLHALKWKYFLVSDLIFWNYISRRKWFALHTRYDMVNNLWLLHFKFSNSSVLYLVHSSRVFLEILLLSHLSIVIFVSLFVYFHFFFFKVSCVVVSIF